MNIFVCSTTNEYAGHFFLEDLENKQVNFQPYFPPKSLGLKIYFCEQIRPTAGHFRQRDFSLFYHFNLSHILWFSIIINCSKWKQKNKFAIIFSNTNPNNWIKKLIWYNIYCIINETKKNRSSYRGHRNSRAKCICENIRIRFQQDIWREPVDALMQRGKEIPPWTPAVQLSERLASLGIVRLQLMAPS